MRGREGPVGVPGGGMSHRPPGNTRKVSGMRNIQFTEEGIPKGNRNTSLLTWLSMITVMAIAFFYPGFATTAWSWPPEGTYVGFGLSQFKLTTDHPSIGSENGGGYQVVFGRYGTSSFSGEIIMSGGLSFPTEPVPDPYYPEDSAEYSYIMFGGRFHLMDLALKKVSPWIGLGWAWHSIGWNSYFYDIDGTSITPYAGVDVLLGGGGGLLRVELRRHSFSASSGWYGGNYDVDVEEFNMSLGYLFR